MHNLAYLFTCDNRNRGLLRMNFDEAACLYRYAQQSGGNILEIGRRFGGSLALLLEAAQAHQQLYSVDLVETIDERLAFLREDPRVHIWVRDSRTCPRVAALSLLLVDGDHTEQGVRADIERHWPSLMVGGVAAFHDAAPNAGLPKGTNHHGGVVVCVQELLGSGKATYLETAGSLVVVEKAA